MTRLSRNDVLVCVADATMYVSSPLGVHEETKRFTFRTNGAVIDVVDA